MTKVYSYVRFSSPEQAKGDSLRRQTAKAEAWCRERGLQLDTSLKDLGISAFRGDNAAIGALRSFIDLVDSGTIPKGSILIVESLDRLSREAVLDAAARLFDLIRAGITVVTLSDGQEYSAERLRLEWTPLVVSIAIMARAHEESRIKGERVGEAWAKKRIDARTQKTPMTSRCPEWLKVENGKFSLIPERVETVRLIFQLSIAGYGRRLIVKKLNSEGVSTFRGKNGWQESTIAKIVGSRATLGEYQPYTGAHKSKARRAHGEPICDYYPAIIDENTFWSAQYALQSRKTTGGRKGNTGHHILQGIAKCGDCGGPMHVINKGKPPKGGIYYSCSFARRRHKCSHLTLYRADKISETLFEILTNFFPRLLNFEATKTPEKLSPVHAMTAKLATLHVARDRMKKLAEETDFEESAFERYRELVSEIKSIEMEIKEIRHNEEIQKSLPDLQEQLDIVKVLKERMNQSDEIGKTNFKIQINQNLRSFIEEVKFSENLGPILIQKRVLLNEINRSDGFVILNTKNNTQVLFDKEASHENIEIFVGRKLENTQWHHRLYFSEYRTNDEHDQTEYINKMSIKSM